MPSLCAKALADSKASTKNLSQAIDKSFGLAQDAGMPKPDLITTQEALAILGYADPSSVSRLVALKKLKPAMKLKGTTGAFLFNRADVEALAAENAAA